MSWHIMSTVKTYGTKITGMAGISFSKEEVAHNVHEADRIGRVQEGGTGLLMFGPLTEYLDMPGSEKDATGLGRWTRMLLKGGTGVQTRIICGYNPCRSNRQNNGTSYSQQRRYQIWQQQDHTTCPRVKFREDLGKLLKEWRAAGDKLIVCIDANENIYKQAFGKLLTDPKGLGMIEAVGRYTGKNIGPTYFRGHVLSVLVASDPLLYFGEKDGRKMI